MPDPKNPVNWFEIPVSDMERAKAFYGHVFGVQFQDMPVGSGGLMAMFPWVEGKPGAAGSLFKQETYTPSHDGTMVYFSVEDIDATLKRVEEKGGKIYNPKTSIGEFGFVGHLVDSEGNRVGLHSVQ